MAPPPGPALRRTGRLPAAGVSCVLLGLWLAGAGPAAAETRHVVLLYDERTDLPGLSVLDAGLVRTLTAGSPEPVEVYREALDLSRFGSDAYLDLLRGHLRAKYAERPIDLVVAVLGPSLDFLLAQGDRVFPEAPIVFCGIDRKELGDRPLPPHVTGVLLKREFAPTLGVALRLHPGTRHVVFVAGTSEFDRRLLEQARSELAHDQERLDVRYLTTLPMDELLAELARLPPHTVVLYSTVFRDGAGEAFVPHQVVERVSTAANAPVYGFVDQYLGLGIVGGHLYGLGTHGEEAARLVLRILAGADPRDLPLVEPRSGVTMFDWRQIERWGLDPALLPAGSVVRFREPSLWSQYRVQVIGAGGLVVLQALMIGALLLQRARRRRAETERRETQVQMRRNQAELAHVARVATVGELTASVAHELKQPLTAILSNAEAAEMLLDAERPAWGEVREILVDIQREDQRAASIIQSLRSLLEKHELVLEPIPLDRTVAEVVHLVRPEAAERGVDLRFEPAPGAPRVLADRVHLQQVVMNLLLNGLEAMAAVPETERHLVVGTETGPGTVRISVSDTGPGLPAEQSSKLFEPFWTTKEHGLGIGLSITRTIVEAHQGRVWAENNYGAGATFHVSLPLLDEREA